MIDVQNSRGQTEFPQGVEQENGIRAARNGHADPPIAVACDAFHTLRCYAADRSGLYRRVL